MSYVKEFKENVLVVNIVVDYSHQKTKTKKQGFSNKFELETIILTF